MSTQSDEIAPGFGERLRLERVRLGLTQAEFAERAGVQRLAQGQYEAETRDPRVKYLAAASAAGVNLYYVLFGHTTSIASLPQPEQRRIERHVFDLIEDYVRVQCSGQLSAEGRFVLFEVIRGHLIRAVLEGAGTDMDISNILKIN